MNKKTNCTKLETVYNILLLIITILTVVLFPSPIFILVKYTYNLIVGLLTPQKLSILLGVELAFFGTFLIPMMVALILLSIFVHIFLIIKAIRLRKVKERLIKVYDFIYLIILAFLLVIITSFYNNTFLLDITLCGIYIEIILLIIILIIRKKKKKKDSSKDN